MRMSHGRNKNTSNWTVDILYYRTLPKILYNIDWTIIYIYQVLFTMDLIDYCASYRAK